jgi:hypothetical protein
MNADVIIYDALGREVAHIASGKQTAGKHRVYFEGEGLSSGIYFCNLITPAGSKRMKMLLLK